MALMGSASPVGQFAEFGKKLDPLKGFFFDRAKVLEKCEQQRLRALSRFGAFVRRRAISSIRTTKGPSRPGTPPHAHSFYHSDPKKDRKGKSRQRYHFRDSILFAFQPGVLGGSVVVGPFLFNSSPSNPPVPSLHEKGGSARIRGLGSRRRGYEYKFAHYPKRPYMVPALMAELPKFVHLFRWSTGVAA